MLTTSDEVLKLELNFLRNKLVTRGYPKKLIKIEFSKIKNMTQIECLYGKRTSLKKKTNQPIRDHFFKEPHETKGRLPFIIPYNISFNDLMKHLTKHWYIIMNSNELNELFPEKPFIVYKRNKNLKDILTQTKFS